ncbi:uncharacterized protein BP5553_04557 [Venustampulla echinocandica]|uniref:Cyanovirin-N domain-containing protein n=1 Tax=Venustampulla echinocandica TaxID=2656787 RepID=A0A370TNN0_9HELO|nr:uncharacterized protein BP5553_04557 [Venustampulla echinocandica]RDL37124.1 hypothetical protein BP5553_04557 [Venustampulla echinocandica]
MVNLAAPIQSLLAAASLAEASSLETRTADCRDDHPKDPRRINELAALDLKCVTNAIGTVFRRCGNTIIVGMAIGSGANLPTISSPCKDVARGAGQIMDACSRADGTVMGQAPAWGNGSMILSVRAPDQNGN